MSRSRKINLDDGRNIVSLSENENIISTAIFILELLDGGSELF